jgi:hypothetical protein
MKIKRVISCLLVAVFSMSLLLVQESAQERKRREKDVGQEMIRI